MEQLAIDGGKPVFGDRILKRYLIGEEEKRAVADLLDKCAREGLAFDRYGGEQVDAYEKEFAEYVGTQYATAVSSGTAAIHTS